MGSFISNLRVSRHHPFDFCNVVVIESQAAFIDRVQTWVGVGGSGEEGKEAETGQDYYLTVLTDEEKQGERDKSDEDEG